MSDQNQLKHEDLTEFPWLKPTQNTEEKALGPIKGDAVYNALARHLRKKKRKSFVLGIGLDQMENFYVSSGKFVRAVSIRVHVHTGVHY
jgi:hypothetical protein